MFLSAPIQAVIDEFSKFPGIGKKTAQRLSLHLLKNSNEDVTNFLNAVSSMKEKIKFCKNCFNLTEFDECEICTSPKRDQSIICVVEEASDVIAIEKTHEFSGAYHVLGGVLSPLSGVTHEHLKINELIQRLNADVKEVILALNPDTEGETTTLYLAKLVKAKNISVSRIARGIPIGGDLEFSDEATIGRAVTGRISF